MEKEYEQDVPKSLGRYLDEKAVAECFGIAVATLRQWRWLGKGPRFFKFGGNVRYLEQDLISFATACERSSTTEWGRDSD